MIKKAVVLAFVVFLKVVADAYSPIPIPIEFIATLVLGILALIGVDVVEYFARVTIGKLQKRGLWK